MRPAAAFVTLLCVAGATICAAALPAGAHFKGRVLYQGTKTPAGGVTVQVVEAKGDGKPTDEVLGETRADADGTFTVALAKATDEKVALVVAAMRSSARTGGDRRAEGYDIKTRSTLLGWLSFPSPTKANTIYIARRRVGQEEDDD